MLLPVHCISLRVVKHSDTTSIVTVWSRERGRLVIATPSGSGREAQRRRALMMPFSIFEGVVDIRNGKDISRIRDVKPYLIGSASGFDPIRNVVALYLADFLNAVLRENQPDERLTDFIFESAETLKAVQKNALANFHLYFTYRLGQFLGIAPDTGTYAPGRCFDMREGIFTATAPLHNAFLDAKGAAFVMILSRLNPRNLGCLHLTHKERNEILDAILEYYTMHHTPVTLLSSLQILRSIFSE